jgi:NAD(P)-dependent dehydrogenase (short-subunit alcohol dehydrogenase family)
MPGYFDLNKRVALVTGASRGLGLAMAEALPEVGATVILNGRDANTLKIAADRMRDRGVKAETGVRHQRRHRRRGGPFLVDPLVRIENPERVQARAELRTLLRDGLLPGHGILRLLIRALLVGRERLAAAQHVVRPVVAVGRVQIPEIVDEAAQHLNLCHAQTREAVSTKDVDLAGILIKKPKTIVVARLNTQSEVENRRPQNPNCSRKIRSSRLWPGSNSMCMEML